MRVFYLSKKPWQELTTKVSSRNFIYLRKMSANSPPGRSTDGDDPVDRSPPSLVPNVPPNPTDSLVDRLRDLDVNEVRRFLATRLGFYQPPAEPPRPPKKVLSEVNLDGIVKYINSERCRNIITLSGAGISTSAGIPDFRSPQTGLYHNLQKYNLPEPQAIFEIDFFRQNPKPFFTLAKELYPGNFKPTVSHYFIRLLHEKGLLRRHYTQNIDTLERGANIPSHKIVEAHGTFYTSHCLDCRKQYDLEFVKERITADQIPICTECPGIVKPDIVFFGESLPDRFHRCVESDFAVCDMLIIMGSSLEVQPFASLIDLVPEWCPRLLINREPAGVKPAVLKLLGVAAGGLLLDAAHGAFRDVARLGDCDAGCQDLADRLGWGDELRALVAREHARLESEGVVGAPRVPAPHPVQIPNGHAIVPNGHAIVPHDAVPNVPHVPNGMRLPDTPLANPPRNGLPENDQNV